VVLLFERPVDGLGHPHLRWSELIVSEPLFENAAGSEEITHHSISVCTALVKCGHISYKPSAAKSASNAPATWNGLEPTEIKPL